MDKRKAVGIAILTSCTAVVSSGSTVSLPDGFILGAATAAYQIEGAATEGGRMWSIWDTFSHIEGNTYNNQTGDVACDHYHHVSDDIQLMKDMGLKHYRMSLSWPRIMPDGVNVNEEGVAFYDNLFSQLIEAGIEPAVTLYHWDLPQELDNTMGGWLNASITDYFLDYAKFCFEHFGEKYNIKYWITFNEPLTFVNLGYSTGTHAPGRCTDCDRGDSSTEPYTVAHNVLNTHAATYRAYKETEQGANGKMGITLNSVWGEPLDASDPTSVAAAERFVEFELAWFADPVFLGDYPAVMRKRVGDRLPTFTEDEREALLGAWDFFGLNHYTSKYIASSGESGGTSWADDCGTTSYTKDLDGNAIGADSDSSWLKVVPWGFRKSLNWVKDRYDNPPILVTENGVSVPGESDAALEDALADTFRVDFYSQYIGNMSLAIDEDGVDVQGYFAWSFMDNFEWTDGYNVRFGMHYVDYDTEERYAKDSSRWYKDVIANNGW